MAKVKLSQDLMDKLVAGEIDGPTAMKVEGCRRSAAKYERLAARLTKKAAEAKKAADEASADADALLTPRAD